MQKMTWREMTKLFRDYNKTKPPVVPVVGYIIFAPESYRREYSLEPRTYMVCSDCNWFNNRISCSLYGDCLDGTDRGVRLDCYMQDFGNKGGWIVADCYVDDLVMEKILAAKTKNSKEAL